MNCAFGLISNNSLLNPRSKRLSCLFLSWTFIVLCSTFKSINMIHLEVIFVQGVKFKVHFYFCVYISEFVIPLIEMIIFAKINWFYL